MLLFSIFKRNQTTQRSQTTQISERFKRIIRIQRRGSNSNRKMCRHVVEYIECDYKKQVKNKKRSKCGFAHNSDELKKKDGYGSNHEYKELKCKSVICDNKKHCIYYHSINERRETILKNVFSQIKPFILNSLQLYQKLKQSHINKINIKDCPPLPQLQNKLNFSKLIPLLTTFEKDLQIYLCNEMLDIFKFINDIESTNLLTDNTNGNNQIVKQGQVNGIILNLAQTDSLLKGTENSFIVESLSIIPILKFKHYNFSYERNKLKGQVSYLANSNGLVTFICQDMLSQKPKSLKLDIQSLNKDFVGFRQIMNTISECKQSLCKLDLCVREFIGPNDIPDLEKVFSNTLLSLDNLKVLNLKIQFDYLEDGNYERDMVDIMTDIISEMKKNKPRLIFQLNIFGIVVKLSGFSLELCSEDSKTDSLKAREKKNQMFSYSNLHQYLLNKFSQKFESKMIKFLTIDFSNLYLQRTQKEVSDPHSQYINELEKLFEGMIQIINGINDQCIEKLRMKFCGFSFLFENLDNLKRSYFRVHMNSKSISPQNTTVFKVSKFRQFYELLQKKLSNKYQYSTYEGDIFSPKYSSKTNNDLNLQKELVDLDICNQSQFIRYMIKGWENVMTIKIQNKDVRKIQDIIKIRQQLTHVIPERIHTCYSSHREYCPQGYQIYDCNQYIDFFRRRYLYIYAKMKKIRQRNPQFAFRKEILQQIFDLIKLSVDDCQYNNSDDDDDDFDESELDSIEYSDSNSYSD